MPWQKGQSGNPNGRPKGTPNYINELYDALKTYKDKKGKKFDLYKHTVERMIANDAVLIAIWQKLAPNLKSTDFTGEMVHDLKRIEVVFVGKDET